MQRFNKRWLLLIPTVVLVFATGFVIWAASPSGELMTEAQLALASDESVRVTHDSWIVFTPTNTTPTTGFIFYPGGRVLAEAYAPLMRKLAEAGYLVVITPMPLNLAVFDADAAYDVLDAYPQITAWAVGGHSLGGAMAANFVKNAPQTDLIKGLVLWASYPQTSDDLAAREDLTVGVIYGSMDGLATVEKIEASRPYLPANTTFVTIEGGNHAQFGWYGDQDGDNPATITREAQQAQIYAATRAVLEQITPAQ